MSPLLSSTSFQRGHVNLHCVQRYYYIKREKLRFSFFFCFFFLKTVWQVVLAFNFVFPLSHPKIEFFVVLDTTLTHNERCLWFLNFCCIYRMVAPFSRDEGYLYKGRYCSKQNLIMKKGDLLNFHNPICWLKTMASWSRLNKNYCTCLQVLYKE